MSDIGFEIVWLNRRCSDLLSLMALNQRPRLGLSSHFTPCVSWLRVHGNVAMLSAARSEDHRFVRCD